MKVRIIEKDGMYEPQYKFLFWWLTLKHYKSGEKLRESSAGQAERLLMARFGKRFVVIKEFKL